MNPQEIRPIEFFKLQELVQIQKDDMESWKVENLSFMFYIDENQKVWGGIPQQFITECELLLFKEPRTYKNTYVLVDIDDSINKINFFRLFGARQPKEVAWIELEMRGNRFIMKSD